MMRLEKSLICASVNVDSLLWNVTRTSSEYFPGGTFLPRNRSAASMEVISGMPSDSMVLRDLREGDAVGEEQREIALDAGKTRQAVRSADCFSRRSTCNRTGRARFPREKRPGGISICRRRASRVGRRRQAADFLPCREKSCRVARRSAIRGRRFPSENRQKARRWRRDRLSGRRNCSRAEDRRGPVARAAPVAPMVSTRVSTDLPLTRR